MKLGYLEADEILTRVSKGKRGPKNLRTLLSFLKWPGEIESLTVEESIEMLLRQAKYVKEQRRDLAKLNHQEVTALSILESDLPLQVKQEVFGDAASEEHLKAPVAKFLGEKGFAAYEEVKIGKSKADLVGWRKAWSIQNKLWAIELKVNPDEMKRSLDQITDYGKAADETFLGATPFAIIRYLRKYGRSWYSNELLEEKLEKVGAGLIVVDMGRGENQCWVEIEGKNELTDSEKKDEIVNLVKTLHTFR